MTDIALRELAARARAAGLLAPDAVEVAAQDAGARPWPVILLTALGAWLAIVPLLIFVALLLPYSDSALSCLLLGLFAAVPAVAMLRRRGLPLFLEQLAFPLLLTGLCLLCLGVAGGFSATHIRAALVFGCFASLTCAALIPRSWLRTILGALAAAFLGFGWLGEDAFGFHQDADIDPLWLAWHQVLLPGVVAAFWPTRRARLQAALDAVIEGWLAAIAVALAVIPHGSILLFGALETGWASALTPTVSSLLALAAAALLLRHRPWASALRHLPQVLVAVALAVAMPSFGGVLLIGALGAARGQRRLATVAGLAALWIASAFYYQLHWTLTTKGLLLLALGGVLAVVTLLQRQSTPAAATAATTADNSSGRRGLLLASPLLLLVLAAWSIIGNERIIAHGEPIFVQLVPVDPRSLMAGDYMALRFDLPDELPPISTGFERPRIALTPDARGVVIATRLLGQQDAPQPGEIALKLTLTGQGWTLVTDAWYFREGEAERWSTARYGEFRVLADGRALLVGLRDESLKAL